MLYCHTQNSHSAGFGECGVMAKIDILHTSDLHNNLTPELAEKLAHLKQSLGGALLLDSGDAIRSGNVGFNPFGERALALMNTAGYDAMCIGNREYHFLSRPMRAKLSRANFVLLSANLVGPNPMARVQPHIDFTLQGIRVRVFGLSVPCVTRRMAIHRISGQYFVDPVERGVQIAAELREGCDILIALTHIGLDRDQELANNTPHIDIILGGHTHTVTKQPVYVGKTAILHHGYHAEHLGHVVLEFTEGSLRVENRLLELGKQLCC